MSAGSSVKAIVVVRQKEQVHQGPGKRVGKVWEKRTNAVGFLLMLEESRSWAGKGARSEGSGQELWKGCRVFSDRAALLCDDVL